MSVELRLPWRSNCAHPMQASDRVPGPPMRVSRTCAASDSMVALGKLRKLKMNGSAGVGS
jgi:hypothetical protein